MKEIGFQKGEILVPKEYLLERFSVVACDQFTSQPDYWNQVEGIAAGFPSSFHMILPEARLDSLPLEEKCSAIHATMKTYLDEERFDAFPDALIYTERTLRNGKIRKGLIGLLDLEQYDYRTDATTLARSTEKTVVERLPARIATRKGAMLEMSHVLMLIDDPEKTVIEPLGVDKPNLNKLYDFDLMQGGRNIKGYLLEQTAADAALKALSKLCGKLGEHPMLFAAGDGNHSLAAAKECYNELKERLGKEALKHPARYALVELNNVHDDSLEFDAIHRVVFGVGAETFKKEWAAYSAKTKASSYVDQVAVLLTKDGREPLGISSPTHPLAVGSIQEFLDKHPEWKIDYVHGEEAVAGLVEQGALGILLAPMKKAELFFAVVNGGSLPRKTFSMGHAEEKRYYVECRKIMTEAEMEALTPPLVPVVEPVAAELPASPEQPVEPATSSKKSVVKKPVVGKPKTAEKPQKGTKTEPRTEKSPVPKVAEKTAPVEAAEEIVTVEKVVEKTTPAVKKTVEKSVEATAVVEESVEKSDAAPVTVEKPVEKSVEAPAMVENPVENTAETAIEQPSEKVAAAKKPTQRTAQQPKSKSSKKKRTNGKK